MFKAKAFNFVNKAAPKKRENLYKPKVCRWMKNIVIPANIGLILLFILMNIDFSVGTNTKLSIVPTIGESITVTTLMPMPPEQRARSFNLQLKNAKNILTVATCRDQSGDKCTILCSNGNLNYLDSDLEHTNCNDEDNLSLIIKNCSFPWRQLVSANFNGFFHIKRLTIINSDLTEIADDAFDNNSIKNLLVLNMSTTDMTKLTDRSFNGLIALQELKLSNMPSFQNFVGVKFLQPLAKTLQQLSFSQKSSTQIYNPFSWFDGNEKYMSVTRVDLSGNNFANTLTEKTFSNFPAVQELILADCALTVLDANTFIGMTDTLKYLDLSSNALKVLNISALASIIGLRLELHSNEWNCTCENYELLTALQASQFTYGEEPLCLTPSQCKDKPLKEVTLKCEEEPSTTQEPPSSVTTSPVVSERTTHTTKTNINTNINTTSSPEESTRIMETSPNITKTTLTTTSPVENPSNTTKSTLSTTHPVETSIQSFETSSTTTTTIINTPSIFDTTDASLEISSSSSTSSEGEETEESEVGKITNIATSASKTTTSPRPPKQPTPAPVILTELPCKHMLDAATPSNYTIYIRYFDIRFTVRPTSSSSVVLLISNFEQHLKLIYFTANNRTYVSTTVKSGLRSLRTSASHTMIYVENLNSNETYIFCLKSTEEHTMSSFNCQSHHIENRTLQESTAWLLTNDQAWFCIVITFIIMLTLCLGIITVYWLLRWRPTWLRGCKRIIRTDAITHEVHLLPKPPQCIILTRNSNGIRSNLSLDLDPCDYMQFYKNMQHAYRNSTIHTLSSILAPKEQAPAVPQNQAGANSLHLTILTDDLIEHCEVVDDNDYQSINYYEQLF